MTRTQCALMIAALLSLAACRDNEATAVARTMSPASKPSKTITGTCGVSFTADIESQDSVAESFGVPVQQEENNVCETWTGSDYTWSYDVPATVESMQSVLQRVQSTSYASGYVHGYDASGAEVDSPTPVGATLFDLMQADNAARQASYDDPYYVIRADGLCDAPTTTGCTSGGGTCIDPTAPGCSCDPYAIDCSPYYASGTHLTETALPTLSFVLASPAIDDGKYARHGIRRLGVRALIDDRDEIAPTSRGYRQFRKVNGAVTSILTIHPALGLLVGEETTSGDLHLVARHVWRRTATGYLRERSEIDTQVMVDGKSYGSRTTIRFSKVTVNE